MHQSYKLSAKAKLPVSFAGGVKVDMLSFIRDNPEDEATVLVYKAEDVYMSPNQDFPLVRLHSACVTGEVFG